MVFSKFGPENALTQQAFLEELERDGVRLALRWDRLEGVEAVRDRMEGG